jgi:hypothetical protein
MVAAHRYGRLRNRVEMKRTRGMGGQKLESVAAATYGNMRNLDKNATRETGCASTHVTDLNLACHVKNHTKRVPGTGIWYTQ